MSIQISTSIDEATNQQFAEVCKRIGVTPSNALKMLIKGAVVHNGLPFDAQMPSEGDSKMTQAEMFGCMRGQFKMADDFDAPLDDFVMPKNRAELYGCMKGEIWIADDFDEPLDDFAEYM